MNSKPLTEMDTKVTLILKDGKPHFQIDASPMQDSVNIYEIMKGLVANNNNIDWTFKVFNPYTSELVLKKTADPKNLHLFESDLIDLMVAVGPQALRGVDILFTTAR